MPTLSAPDIEIVPRLMPLSEATDVPPLCVNPPDDD